MAPAQQEVHQCTTQSSRVPPLNAGGGGGERGQEKDGGSGSNAQNHDNRRCDVYLSGVETSENSWIIG